MVIHENGGPDYPLAVEFAPNRLAPTGVGVGEVDGVRGELMPVCRRHQMTEGVGVRMHHHLRLVRGAGGEVHKHGILALVLPVASLPGRRGGHSGLEILEAVRHQGTDAYEFLEIRAFGLRLGDLLQDIGVAAADDGLDLGGFATVDYIVGCQQEGGGDGDGTYLLEGQHGGPEGETALEDEHHEVAAADSQRGQIPCNLVGFALEIGESHPALRLGVAGPDKRKFIRSLFGPGVHDVVCEIEMFGNIELQFLPFLAEKSFQHSGLSLSHANIAKCWISVRFGRIFLFGG